MYSAVIEVRDGIIKNVTWDNSCFKSFSENCDSYSISGYTEKNNYLN